MANYKAAKANVAVGVATIKQNEAVLALAKTNLEYTVIKSPVEGVIVDREVNVGQTVVSSLSAQPVPHCQGSAADPGLGFGQRGGHRPHPRGHARKLYRRCLSRRDFRGRVTQIRLNATMTQNVVTYTVVVVTDNADGRLLPYLTANLQFEIEQRSNVLLVPNMALRWKPRPPQIDPQVRKTALAATKAGPGGKQAVVGASLGWGQAGQTEQRAGRAQPRLGAGRGIGPAGRSGGRPERRIDDRDQRGGRA